MAIKQSTHYKDQITSLKMFTGFVLLHVSSMCKLNVFLYFRVFVSLPMGSQMYRKILDVIDPGALWMLKFPYPFLQSEHHSPFFFIRESCSTDLKNILHKQPIQIPCCRCQW